MNPTAESLSAQAVQLPPEERMALMGRSASGWVEWKAANGKTLDELKRQAVAAVG